MKKHNLSIGMFFFTCFVLVLVMTSCSKGISTDPDNPSNITFPKTANGIYSHREIFYQSIYNSNDDNPDAKQGTIYGCYQGMCTNGNFIKLIACKPKLPKMLMREISDNKLKYFVIVGGREDRYFYDSCELFVFKNDASYDVVSFNQDTIDSYGVITTVGLGNYLTDYALAGAGEIDEAFNKLSMDEENLDSALQCIEALCKDKKMP